MYLISAKGYENTGVHILIIKKSGEIWVSMKNVPNGLGVKNTSDLILKEIYGMYKTKTLRRSKLENTK